MANDPNQQIDLSAGIVPQQTQPNQTPEIDLSAGLAPEQTQQERTEAAQKFQEQQKANQPSWTGDFLKSAGKGMYEDVAGGLKSSMLGQIPGQVKGMIAPPQSSDEHIVHTVGGPAALDAYRTAKGIVKSAKNIMDAQGPEYQQSVQDFNRGIQEMHQGKYGQAATSAAELGVENMPVVGPRMREQIESFREGHPGREMLRNAADLATLELGDEAAPLGEANPIKIAANKAIEAVKGVPDVIDKYRQSRAASAADDLEQAVARISKPAKGQTDYMDSVRGAMPALKQIFKDTPDVSTPQQMYDAIDKYKDAKEDQLVAKAKETRGTEEAGIKNAAQSVRTALQNHFQEAKGAFPEQDVSAAIDKAMDRLGDNPTIESLENLRRQLKRETSSLTSPAAVPSAIKEAYTVVADTARGLINDKFEDLGVKGVKEWREQEKDLIDVRDQIEKAFNKADEMGHFNLKNAAVKNFGWHSIGAMLPGFYRGSIPEMALGAGTMTATGLIRDYLLDRMTNPNIMVQKAAELARKAPGGGAAELTQAPVQQPLPMQQGPLFEVQQTPAAARPAPSEMGEQQTALAKVPGTTPTTHIPSSQYGIKLPESIQTAPPQPETGPARLPAAKQEDITPASSGTYRTAGVVKLPPKAGVMQRPLPRPVMPEVEVAKPEPQARSFGPEGEEKGVPRETVETPKKNEPVRPVAQIKEEAQRLAKMTDLQFRGIQEGIPGKHPGVAIFQDPVSGTSIGVRLDEWSPEQVIKQLGEARRRMSASRIRAAKENEGGLEALRRPNASGESAASQEAVNRVQTRARQGIRTYKVMKRGGQRVPVMNTVDNVDIQPTSDYDVVDVYPDGREIRR